MAEPDFLTRTRTSYDALADEYATWIRELATSPWDDAVLGQAHDGTWTIQGDPTEAAFLVAEAKVEKIDDFFAVEQKLTTDERVREAMADYHDLVESGRREIFRVES